MPPEQPHDEQAAQVEAGWGGIQWEEWRKIGTFALPEDIPTALRFTRPNGEQVTYVMAMTNG